jgi:hypothetical protein
MIMIAHQDAGVDPPAHPPASSPVLAEMSIRRD